MKQTNYLKIAASNMSLCAIHTPPQKVHTLSLLPNSEECLYPMSLGLDSIRHDDA